MLQKFAGPFVGPLFCGASVRSNMLNMPINPPLWSAFTVGDRCCYDAEWLMHCEYTERQVGNICVYGYVARTSRGVCAGETYTSDERNKSFNKSTR